MVAAKSAAVRTARSSLKMLRPLTRAPHHFRERTAGTDHGNGTHNDRAEQVKEKQMA
jgi:hypothetical protein